jgi:hypothetical protein
MVPTAAAIDLGTALPLIKWDRIIFGKMVVDSRNSLPFLEPEGLLPYTQEHPLVLPGPMKSSSDSPAVLLYDPFQYYPAVYI